MADERRKRVAEFIAPFRVKPGSKLLAEGDRLLLGRRREA
jgi:hypothetical protein